MKNFLLVKWCAFWDITGNWLFDWATDDQGEPVSPLRDRLYVAHVRLTELLTPADY